MKYLLLTLFFSASAFAFAAEEDCANMNSEQIVAAIQAKRSCYEAATLARTCAWGSAIDTQFAGAAETVCAKNYKKISRKDKQALEYMGEKCTAKYEKREGTMYISMNAFCHLTASEFWSEIYSEERTRTDR